jgi:hypothetical protein
VRLESIASQYEAREKRTRSNHERERNPIHE